MNSTGARTSRLLHWPRTAVLALVLLVVCVQAQTLWFQSCKSITVDECFYLNQGIQTVCIGRLDPTLSQAGVAPLPVLELYVPPLSGSAVETSTGLWTGRLDAPALIRWPRRLNVWLNGFPLLALVFLWCRNRLGSVAGLTACLLLGLSPTFLAHAALATTDLCACLYFSLTVYLAECFVRSPSKRRHIAWLFSLSLAVSAKYSNIMLLPHMVLAIAVRHRLVRRFVPTVLERRDGISASSSHRLPALLVMAVIPALIWSLHQFHWSSTSPCLTTAVEPAAEESGSQWKPGAPDDGDTDRGTWSNSGFQATSRSPRTLPAPLTGILNQYRHNRAGHPTFLFGERSSDGWTFWFPLAFLMKSTPVELILALCWLGRMALASADVWRIAVRQEVHGIDIDAVVQQSAALLFAALVCCSRIQIGQRYLLPLYPLILIGGLACLSRLPLSTRRRNQLCLLLIFSQGVSNWSSAPHFLSYFNSFCGGSANGWRLLSDSNLDWGQDLPALRQALERLGSPRTTVIHFGNAVPSSYGIDSQPLCDGDSGADETELLAISATALQGVYFGQADPFRGFRELPPDAVAARSVFLYLINTPRRRSLLRQARELLCDTPGLITNRNPFHDCLTGSCSGCSQPQGSMKMRKFDR